MSQLFHMALRGLREWVAQILSPQYLYGMFSAEYRRDTRQAARLELKADADTPDRDLMVNSFRWRALREYNQLPVELRKVNSLKSFKPSLWKWIRSNISI